MRAFARLLWRTECIAVAHDLAWYHRIDARVAARTGSGMARTTPSPGIGPLRRGLGWSASRGSLADRNASAIRTGIGARFGAPCRASRLRDFSPLRPRRPREG